MKIDIIMAKKFIDFIDNKTHSSLYLDYLTSFVE